MGINGVGSYDEFLKNIQARGLDTTNLGNGEANFEDYASALSAGLKEELLASVGDESGDAALQAKIAGLFGSASVLQSGDIQARARAAGMSVSVEYVSTTYTPDNKADGRYDTDVINGAIAVYTFSDGNSTIKIADANGNGAIETEEVFLNEILGDVTNSIGATSSGAGGSNADALKAIEEQQAALERMKLDQERAEMERQIKEQQEKIEQEILEMEQKQEEARLEQERLEQERIEMQEAQEAAEQALEEAQEALEQKEELSAEHQEALEEAQMQAEIQEHEESLSSISYDEFSEIAKDGLGSLKAGDDPFEAIEALRSEHGIELSFSELSELLELYETKLKELKPEES